VQVGKGVDSIHDCSDESTPGAQRALPLRFWPQVQTLLSREGRGLGERGTGRSGCRRGCSDVRGRDVGSSTYAKASDATALEDGHVTWVRRALAHATQGRWRLGRYPADPLALNHAVRRGHPRPRPWSGRPNCRLLCEEVVCGFGPAVSSLALPRSPWLGLAPQAVPKPRSNRPSRPRERSRRCLRCRPSGRFSRSNLVPCFPCHPWSSRECRIRLSPRRSLGWCAG
jgi:hypothetical protein